MDILEPVSLIFNVRKPTINEKLHSKIVAFFLINQNAAQSLGATKRRVQIDQRKPHFAVKSTFSVRMCKPLTRAV